MIGRKHVPRTTARKANAMTLRVWRAACNYTQLSPYHRATTCRTNMTSQSALSQPHKVIISPQPKTQSSRMAWHKTALSSPMRQCSTTDNFFDPPSFRIGRLSESADVLHLDTTIYQPVPKQRSSLLNSHGLDFCCRYSSRNSRAISPSKVSPAQKWKTSTAAAGSQAEIPGWEFG